MALMWWSDDADERYWMESTDRDWQTVGDPLRNWAETEGGRRIAPTELLDDMKINDIVFHYYQPNHALVGYSRVVTERASHGRGDDRRWIEREIGGYTPISPPVTLADVRAESSRLFNVMDAIKDRGQPPYHLSIINNHGASPPNAYISKVPSEMVELMGLLDSDDADEPPIGTPRKGFKAPPQRPAAADPFPTDPDAVDRGTQAHHNTEIALQEFVEARGAETLDPARGEPPFDLAWTIGDDVWIAEVKSTTAANAEKQLRYGLGQLLRYAQAFASIDPAPNLVLVVEQPVTDAAWIETCRAVNVTLTWPAAFDASLVTPPAPKG